MPQLKQNSDGSIGLQGTDLDDGQFIPIRFHYNTTTPLTFTIASLSRRMIVKQISVRPDVAASNAVTVSVYKAASGTAIGSGTKLHSGTGNIQGTANTNQKLTIDLTANDIAADNAIGAVISGALGAAGSGCITVWLAPA